MIHLKGASFLSSFPNEYIKGMDGGCLSPLGQSDIFSVLVGLTSCHLQCIKTSLASASPIHMIKGFFGRGSGVTKNWSLCQVKMGFMGTGIRFPKCVTEELLSCDL